MEPAQRASDSPSPGTQDDGGRDTSASPPSVHHSPPRPAGVSRTESRDEAAAPSAPPERPRGGARLSRTGLSPSARREAPRRRRTLTADDVKNKTCFICYATEEDDGADQRWIHACKCSLMAHQSCLLTWIAEAQVRSGNLRLPISQREVKCPQCGSAYIVSQRTNPLLTLIERFERHFNALAVRTAVLGVGIGIGAASGVYGYYTSRLFLGPTAASHIFDRAQWPLSYFLWLPTVAPALIAARTSIFEDVLWLVPLAALPVPSMETLASQHEMQLSPVLWPPSPRLTITALLCLRPLYQMARRTFSRAILGMISGPSVVHEPAGPPIIGMAPALQPQEQPAPPAQEEGIEVINNDNREPADEAAHAAARHENQPERMRISLGGLARLTLGALLWPALSVVAGRGLLWIVTPAASSMPSAVDSGYLRTFLGLGHPDVLRSALGWPQMTPSTSQPGMYIGWLSKTIGLSAVDEVPVDPVWWRNAVGGTLLVVIKDVSALFRAILERRVLASRTIKPVGVSRSLDFELRRSESM